MRFIKLLFIIVISLSFSASTAFSSEIKKCKPDLTKFSNFKSDLIDCFNKENKVIDNDIIQGLTDQPSNYLSINVLKEKKFLINNQLSGTKNFEKYFKNIIQENYQSLYGIHLELKSLETNKYISVKNYDEFIENSLEIFDSTISNNGSLNKNLGLAAAAALVVSALDSSSEDGKSITLSLSASSLQENSGTTLTITATASESVASDTTVNLSFSGDATSGTDYSVASSSITILSGSTTGTTTISLTDDSVYEGNESISISTSSITGDSKYTSSSPTASFTILENESAPVITMSAASSTITENSGSNIVLTFTSSQVSDEDITISLSTSGTSSEGTDYSSLSDVTISANSTSNTLNFTPIDDSIYEGDETAIISIDTVSGSDATESASQSVTITITENETAPTLTLTSSASSIAENSGSSLTLTATLSGATSEDVTVTLATSGTATSGTDYTALSNMTITSGQTTTTASFTPTDDNIYEGNETAIIDVDSVSGGSATESGTQQLTLTISDNESAPTVTLTSSASSVSEDGSAITLTATLSNATTADVTVTLSTGGTATEGTDYANLSDITVSAGDTTGTTSLTPTNDSTFEGDETITVDIDTVSGGSATENGTQQVSITFQEDDAGPTLTISDVTTSDESNATFTVTLSPASALSATVDYETTSGGTAKAGSDYTSTSGTLTFAAGETSKQFTVSVTDDEIYDGANETVLISLSNAVRATISDSSATLTITDDESAPTVTMNFNNCSNSTAISTTVAESDGSNCITAYLSNATYENVTVSVSLSGTAGALDYSSDYLSSGDVTINAGNTQAGYSFDPTADSLYEGEDETLIVSMSSVSGGGSSISGTQQLTFTITDAESAPVVTIVSSAASVYDNGSDLTLTAQSTQAADEDITVTLSTSGTASSSSDYALSSSTITIAANATSGTATFNPTADTSNEGAETATISIAVSGADSSTGTPSSVTITINEYALRTETTFTEGTAAEITAITQETNWQNVEGSLSTGSVHPYELMNIHKVQSFSDGTDNLTGKGQFIHIADFNCDDTHEIYSNKTVHNLDDGGPGESTFGAATSINYHCQFVASMAAGDSNADVVGVAPDADLILSSIPNYEGTYSSDDYAADLDSARGYGAVASNNSWALTDNTDSNPNANFNATEMQALIDINPGFTTDQIFGFKFEGNAFVPDAQTSAWQSYVTALNNFQNSGVVVFANGNYSGESDASVLGALPEFYSQLSEAWLTVTLADFTGSSLDSATSSDFTLYGNKCGSAKEYCLTVDDYLLKGGSYVSGGVSQYADNGSGSSYGAPMVAGGIALLAQAFPNHTPEQLTDRVLASANNNWFTAEGNTTFTSHGNSITHGYHSTWGHGVPDFYAALSPITTNSNPASFMISSSLSEGYSDSSGSSRLPVAASKLIQSSALGDSIIEGLKDSETYFYDAMGGGFKYDLSNIVYSKKQANHKKLTIEEEVFNVKNFDSRQDIKSLPNYYSGEFFNFKDDNHDGLSVTINSPSIVSQKFNAYDSSNYQDDTFTNLRGLGLNHTLNFDNSDFTISLLDTSLDPILINPDHSQSLVGSMNFFSKDSTKNLMLSLGHVIEKDTLLFSKGESGLNLGNDETNSNILGINFEKNINDKHNIAFNSLFSITNPKQFNDSLVTGTDEIYTSRFDINYSVKDILDKNNLIKLSISQPTFVEKGAMNFKLPGLADTDGNIPFNNTSISLKPSARQLDYSLGYYTDVNRFTKFGLKTTISQNQNHDADSSIGKNFMSTIVINF